MPELDITPEWSKGKIGQQIAGLKVLAVMVHPKPEEEKLREEFVGSWIRDYIARLKDADLADIARSGLEHFYFSNRYPQLLNAPTVAEVCERLEQSLRPGGIAGEILMYIYRLEQHKHGGTVNKAVFLLKKIYQDKKRKTILTGLRPTASNHNYIRQAWSDYGPVAHLWAAYRLVINTYYVKYRTPPDLDDRLQYQEHLYDWFFRQLPKILLWAEWYRYFEINFIPPRQKKPLLPPQNTWLCVLPPGLEKRTILHVPPLSPQEQSWLDAYRSPKSKRK